MPKATQQPITEDCTTDYSGEREIPAGWFCLDCHGDADKPRPSKPCTRKCTQDGAVVNEAFVRRWRKE